MNYSNYRFNLDVQSTVSQVSLPVRLLDTGRRLYVNLTDGGSPYIIEDGCRAVFSARKADGNPVMNDCIIENNSIIRYDLTAQTTSYPGIVDCEMSLYDPDGKLITSPKFILVVDDPHIGPALGDKLGYDGGKIKLAFFGILREVFIKEALETDVCFLKI